MLYKLKYDKIRLDTLRETAARKKQLEYLAARVKKLKKITKTVCKGKIEFMLRPANPELVEWVGGGSESIAETDQEDLRSENKKLYLSEALRSFMQRRVKKR